MRLDSGKLLPLRTRLAIILLSAALLFGNLWYLHFTWQRYEESAILEAIQLSQSLKSLLPTEYILKLSGQSEDTDKHEYAIIKSCLNQLISSNSALHNAYLYKRQGGSIILLVSSNNILPGHVFEEADDGYTVPFVRREVVVAVIEKGAGKWICALAPITDSRGEVTAVFGIDYLYSEWFYSLWMKMVPEFSAAFIFLLLFLSMIYSWVQHFKLIALNKRLSDDEVFYRTVFEQAPIGIAIMRDKSHTVKTELGDLTINPTYQKVLGRSKEELQQITWPELTHPDDIEKDLQQFEQFKKGEIKNYSMEKRFVRPDGSTVWAEITVTNFDGLSDKALHLCILKDITEQKQAEEELREKNRREAVILAHLPGMAYRCKYDRQWTIEYVSNGCYALTGYAPESLLHNRDLSFNDVISKEYRELLWEEWARILPKRQPFRYEYEIITANGERKLVLELGQGIYGPDGEVEALEGIILDISERKQFEDNLKYLNEHDRLTGLYNREYLERLMEKDLKNPGDKKLALIGFNLSTVQLLTANYGFQYTQNLIRKAADLLAELCPSNAMLFKTYENRFLYYIKGYKDTKELSDIAENTAAVLEKMFAFERIGGGISILEIGRDEKVEVDLLLKRLLIASEKSINKSDREFKVCFYDDKLEAMVNRENDIIEILSAIASDKTEGELFLQFQPIIDIRTSSIYGFEALARLKDKRLGFISPLEFIPIAEKTKLIIPIGKKILRNALTFLKRLNEKGYGSVCVSVNISAIELLRPDFPDVILGIISEVGVDPRNICLEITESVFSSDYNAINNVIRKLRKEGIQLAIDDFGKGYSSLAREKELDVNCLKVDKCFIDKLMEIDAEKAITGDIISMAHKMGHYAVAEGVEHEKQLEYLKRHNCDKVQGYLISKPLDEDKAIEFVENYKIEF